MNEANKFTSPRFNEEVELAKIWNFPRVRIVTFVYAPFARLILRERAINCGCNIAAYLVVRFWVTLLQPHRSELYAFSPKIMGFFISADLTRSEIFCQERSEMKSLPGFPPRAFVDVWNFEEISARLLSFPYFLDVKSVYVMLRCVGRSCNNDQLNSNSYFVCFKRSHETIFDPLYASSRSVCSIVWAGSQ